MKKRIAGKQANMCDSCEENTAAVFCFECKGHLCTECDEELHSSKLLARHTRTSDFEPHICREHGNFTMALCAQCQELICTSCVVDSHRNHEILQLSESFDIVSEEVNQLLQTYNDKLSLVGNVEERLEEESESLHGSCDQVVQSIKENFEIIRQELEEKEAAMLEQVEDFRVRVGSGLKEKETLTDSYATELTQTRRELLEELEQNMNLNDDQIKKDELLYTERLSAFIELYIDNEDRFNSLAEENSEVNLIIRELQEQLNVEKQFCLDFNAVERFVANIENLYIVIEDLGEASDTLQDRKELEQELGIMSEQEQDLQSRELETERI